ncbi:acyl-CoA dehydrogenase [Pandoraea vervacti]|uniref:Acyl-CoA dehydrogenase n=1 Tax=Pandoraea vervacti TaxID=656178 RepID=A0ABM5SWD5_9BURK|nr:acyl-CoA dehydrogenase family protein [Pandoraea vervacti]AJP56801.1 acyl-CoA dehydrogenase [Pandoraea vervacti]
MDFTFTEDQLLFRDATRSFLMVEASLELLRALWETDAGRSTDLRSKFAAQGLTGLSVDAAYGGLGLGDVDWALLLHELGYFAIPDSLTDTAYLAAGLLGALPAGNAAKSDWLPRLVDGSARVAIGYPVNPLVADAHLADVMLLAHEGEIHAVSRVDVDLIPNTSVDLSRRLFHVIWQPSAKTRLTDATAGQPILRDLVNRGAISTAGQLLGLAARMLDLSIDYTAERKQFGKPIGSFQAVKHLLADVAVKLEFAKPVVYRAAYALATEHPHRDVYVSAAKLAAADTAALAARHGIQVHGAMGYTWELDLQIFVKRALALTSSWGDRAFHKQRVGAFVFAPDAQLGPADTFNHTD